MGSIDHQQLSQRVHSLLYSESFQEAKTLLFEELDKKDFNTRDDLMYLVEIAGLLIDLGNEGYDEESTKEGLEIFDKNKELFKSIITETSLDYCIANGKHALYKIHLRGNPGIPTPEIIKQHLAESKNHYYRAFKTLDLNNLDGLGLQIMTNLGNDLDHSGRAIEAIQLFDMVLAKKPDFPQALGSKADAIRYWMQISKPPVSIALFATMYHYFKLSLEHQGIPPQIREANTMWMELTKERIIEEGFSIDEVDKEFAISIEEKEAHTPYRKFCLDNFLTLSEHAIYCPCSAASKDDLSIGYPGVYLLHEKLPKMELTLNRIKSEFSLSRKLFYEASIELENPQKDDVVYMDLYEEEVIGLASEKLRTSFRMCFGIFDRIAHAICYFFELRQSPNEDIYFEKFWYNPKKPERWQKINQLSNIHLSALYSIACDLNDRSGEFGLYKEWRNRLEHEIMILRNDEASPDLLKVLEDETFLNSHPIITFQNNALHLLRLCRSAIFSFAYAIRQEVIRDEKEDHRPTVSIASKPD